jgi:hypothetical protein
LRGTTLAKYFSKIIPRVSDAPLKGSTNQVHTKKEHAFLFNVVYLGKKKIFYVG